MTKKFLAGALAIVVALLPSLTLAEGFPGIFVQPFKTVTTARNISAVKTDVGAWVKYVGTSASAATVEVDAATGDITFKVGGAADSSVKCPSGGSSGVIDVSDAACDTFTEVASIVNATTTWIFVPEDVLGTDSTNNTLDTLSATSAKIVNGVGLLKDTAVTLNVTTALHPKDQGGASLGVKDYKPAAAGANGSTSKFPANPFADRDTVLTYASENITSSGTVGNFTVYCVVPNFASTGKYTENSTILYLEAGAATTVTGKIDEFLNAGGLRCNGGKLLVRIITTTDLTAPVFVATGYQFPNLFSY